MVVVGIFLIVLISLGAEGSLFSEFHDGFNFNNIIYYIFLKIIKYKKKYFFINKKRF